MDKTKLITIGVSAAIGIVFGIVVTCGVSLIVMHHMGRMHMKRVMYSNHMNMNMNMDREMKDGSSMGMVCQPQGGMPGAMEGMTSNLSSKTGADFDKAFIEQMTLHHEGAIEMAKQALEKATKPEIKKMSEDIIKTQTKEIEQMKSWK